MNNLSTLIRALVVLLHAKGVLSDDEFAPLKESMENGKSIDESVAIIYQIVNKKED